MAKSGDELYLCLDQGGHASRAMVFDAQGDKLLEARRETKSHVDGLKVELDAQALHQEMEALIVEIARRLGADAGRVVAAGLATQRSNIACWERQTGRPLAPILSWQDRRAADLLHSLDSARVHALSGLYPNAHYGASKLAWCLRELPAVRQAAEAGRLCLGPMASYLASILTGATALADPANASRTLLYNLRQGDWDPELCEHFGIRRDWLPRCVPSLYDYGRLSWPGGGLPLRIVTGDLSAAAFVHGRPEEEIAYITLGTGAFVQRITPTVTATDLRLLNGIVWHDGEAACYSLEGTVNGAGSALDWFANEYGLQHPYLLQQLPQWCERITAPPLFGNGVSGLGSPFWQADFEPRFIGEGGIEARAVAVVESIVFLLYENLRLMHRYLSPPRRILVSGGLSALDGLCQRLADLADIEVVRSAESEGTAKGLAYLLAGLPQSWHSACERSFTPCANEVLQQRYGQWRQWLYRETDYND